MDRGQEEMRSLARRKLLPCLGLALATALFGAGAAYAEKIQNPIAVFAALDKVTGRISHLEIPIGQTVQFGALRVTPRICNTRPPTEPPHTTSFVEVDEIRLSGEVDRIFTGWMFADSPGLHAVEHPVFDVWLTNCMTSAPERSSGNAEKAADAPADPVGEPEAEPAPEPAAEPEAAPAPEPEPPIEAEPPPREARPPSPRPRQRAPASDFDIFR